MCVCMFSIDDAVAAARLHQARGTSQESNTDSERFLLPERAVCAAVQVNSRSGARSPITTRFRFTRGEHTIDRCTLPRRLTPSCRPDATLGELKMLIKEVSELLATADDDARAHRIPLRSTTHRDAGMPGSRSPWSTLTNEANRWCGRCVI